MSEQSAKKIRIHQIAKELNLSHETIIEFLKKKGLEVKGHMTLVTEEMDALIMAHFKKDKDTADKHHKKISEFRASRKKESSAKGEKKTSGKEKGDTDQRKPAPAPALPIDVISHEGVIETQAEALAAAKEHVTVQSGKLETTDAGAVPGEDLQRAAKREDIEHVQKSAQPSLPAETSGSLERGKATKEREERTAVDRTTSREQQAEAAKKEKKTVKTGSSPLELVTSRPQRGLTIKGKMDLGVKTAADKPAQVESKKKKKKKKVREESKKQKDVRTDEEEVKTRKRKRSRHQDVDQAQVTAAIRETFAGMDEGTPSSRALLRKKKRKEREEAEQLLEEQRELEKTIVRVTEFVAVGELANLMGVTVAEVIQKCIGLGMMVSINQRLEKDTIILVADEFGFQVQFEKEFSTTDLLDIVDRAEDLVSRPPVVTIMGHVDHGKTSLLDYIRNANVVAGEAGGITQHIGAYEVTLPGEKSITFLDTPGHEAFTAMRARGAQATDIVVLVVAADDNVMPTTVEAINHAQAASVPIVIAMNKIDRADSNPERIRQQLSDKGVLVEEWGGKYQAVEISAKKGTNIEKLLEKILLEAEILDLKANPNRRARGVIIESELDKGKGIMATMLVQKGSLRVGDPFVCGVWSGRVRAMFDERGHRVESVGPSTPVQMTGFDGIPQAGDVLVVMEDERFAREISMQRQLLKREQDFRQQRMVTLDDISQQIQAGGVKDLPMIIKGDVDGSVEALADALLKLSTPEVKVRVIHKGVGAISEADVLLATASRAIIIGFHVRPNLNARRLAQHENVEIRLYSIIYNVINEIKAALEGMLAPTVTEDITGTAEIREVFKVSKVGTIAGCHVIDGKIVRNNKVRLIRDSIVVFDGTLTSLKRFKDDVREVETGFECGIGLENYNDIKVGDLIEAYTLVETKRKL
jgi:translation initiation factor IF-2